MTKATRITLSVIGAVAVIAVIVFNITTAQHKGDGTTNTLPAIVSTAAPDRTAKPSSTPTADPTSDDELPNSGGGTEYDTGATNAVVDLAPFEATAQKAVTAFVTWDSAESAASRAKRVAKYASATADLGREPKIGYGDYAGYVGLTSRVQVQSIDAVGFTGKGSTGSYYFSVFVTYLATYDIPSHVQQYSDRVEYQVSINPADTAHVEKIIEP